MTLILTASQVAHARLNHQYQAADTNYPVPAQNVLWVAPSENPNLWRPKGKGTRNEPFDSIKAAISRASDGTTIILKSGAYREPHFFVTKNHITLQAEPHGNVWLKGSTVVPAERFEKEGNLWKVTGDFQNFCHVCTLSAEPALAKMSAYPEQVFINDEPLRQVLSKAATELEDLFSKYRISEALTLVYKLIRDDFSSYYLELIKPAYGTPIDRVTCDEALGFFDEVLRILHPFMPFITEELWQNLAERKEGESIMNAQQRPAGSFDEAFLARFAAVQELITSIRSLRTSKNLSPREALTLEASESYPSELDEVLIKMAGLSEIDRSGKRSEGAVSFVIGTDEFAVPMAAYINVEEELAKLRADLEYQQKFLAGVEKKLSNESFVSKAPEAVIALEQKKKADAESRIASIEQSIRQLSGK